MRRMYLMHHRAEALGPHREHGHANTTCRPISKKLGSYAANRRELWRRSSTSAASARDVEVGPGARSITSTSSSRAELELEKTAKLDDCAMRTICCGAFREGKILAR